MNLPLWRRRQTLVNPEHQLKFTSVLLIEMTVIMLAIAAFSFDASHRTMELVLRRLTDFPVSSHELHVANQAFLGKILLVLGLTAGSQILFGLYASHKLAGPIVQMTRVLRQAGAGDFSGRVGFRKGDHLEDLAVKLNQTLGGFGAEQARLRADVAAIAAELDRFAQADPPSDEDIEQFRRRLADLAGVEMPVPETVSC